MRAPKNRTKKVARQKESHLKLVRLEQAFYHLIESGRLTEDELNRIKFFKATAMSLNKAGYALKGTMYNKYVTLRAQLLNKYYNPEATTAVEAAAQEVLNNEPTQDESTNTGA
jgi:hypothetical protein